MAQVYSPGPVGRTFSSLEQTYRRDTPRLVGVPLKRGCGLSGTKTDLPIEEFGVLVGIQRLQNLGLRQVGRGSERNKRLCRKASVQKPCHRGSTVLEAIRSASARADNLPVTNFA
jgi:hypothetical protein